MSLAPAPAVLIAAGLALAACGSRQCQRPDDACVRDNDCPPIDGGTARLYACQSQPAGRRCE